MQNRRAALTGAHQREASFTRTLAQSTYYGAAGAFGKAPIQPQKRTGPLNIAAYLVQHLAMYAAVWQADNVGSNSTSSATTTSAGFDPLLRPHMPELDTIRGLAILGVLLYHGLYWARDFSAYLPWQRAVLKLASPGQYGVNLFFVLSGFLISGILLDSRQRRDYYQRFYFRRALRILPAYYATLLLLVVFGITSRGFLYMSLLYSSNLSMLFGIAMSYPVLWSLAVEEHFYFLWPAATKNFSNRYLEWIVGFLMVFSPIMRFLCHQGVLGEMMPKAGCSYYTWNTADGLALGALIALLVRKWNQDRQKLRNLSMGLIVVGSSIALTGLPFGIQTRMNPVGEALQWVPWNLWCGGVLGVFLLVGSGPNKKWVAPRAMIFLGQISYGLYLYHLFVFQLYKWIANRSGFEARLGLWARTWCYMLCAGLAAITVAYLSRKYFEEPFLRLKDRWTPNQAKQEIAIQPLGSLVLGESEDSLEKLPRA
jgi:peptidoglycan/LPS O-acetylase OafA/YrhL